jgi:hypothetical protein
MFPARPLPTAIRPRPCAFAHWTRLATCLELDTRANAQELSWGSAEYSRNIMLDREQAAVVPYRCSTSYKAGTSCNIDKRLRAPSYSYWIGQSYTSSSNFPACNITWLIQLHSHFSRRNVLCSLQFSHSLASVYLRCIQYAITLQLPEISATQLRYVSNGAVACLSVYPEREYLIWLPDFVRHVECRPRQQLTPACSQTPPLEQEKRQKSSWTGYPNCGE